MELSKVRREGERLIKYQMNVSDTKHMFCYKMNGLYYTFVMCCGRLVDHNDNLKLDTDLKGSSRRGKFFKEYYNSTLNQYFVDK